MRQAEASKTNTYASSLPPPPPPHCAYLTYLTCKINKTCICRHHPLSPVFPSPLCIDPESVHQPADSLRFPSRRPPQKIKDSIKTLDKQARQITSLVNRIHSTPPAQRLSHSTYSCLPLPQPITSSDLSFSRAWTDRSFFLWLVRRERRKSAS